MKEGISCTDCQYSLFVNDTGADEILCNRPNNSTNPFVSLQYDCPMGKAMEMNKYTGGYTYGRNSREQQPFYNK
ncbi:MAG TPA: hypothetical protein DDW62_12320 [Marinilabiliaceae bacterium]|nr:hypothetical protein [Marinilabiliaceae bacterium]